MSDGDFTHFGCGCGARLRAPQGSAGRSIRCPKCKAVSTIPPVQAAHPIGATEPTTQSDAARVKFSCECGKSLNVAAGAVGKRVKCPACAAVQVVPRQNAATGSGLALDDELDALAAALSKGEVVTDYDRPAPTLPPHSSDRFDDFRLAPPVELPRDRPEVPIRTGPPRKCPSCAKQYPGSAKICVACGVDLKTGRAIVTVQDENLDRTYELTENSIRVVSWLIPIGLFPIASEAFGLRKPWVIRGVALATVLISAWFFFAVDFNDNPSAGALNLMLWCGERDDFITSAVEDVTDDNANGSHEKLTQEERDAIQAIVAKLQIAQFHPYQLITHAFLHGGIMHLIGNMVFLVVLGTRVNALIGNMLTLIIYPLLAVLAGVFHMVAMRHEPLHPMIGASGAIMGLAGMYLVHKPTPNVHMAAWWRLGWITAFRLSSSIFPVRGFWVVLFYIAFDVAAVAFNWIDGTAHWAHLGGFISGIVIAMILLFTRLANARGGDILNAIMGKHAWALIGKPNRPGLTLW